MATLLCLPYELLEAILRIHLSSLEISVRYSRGRVSTNRLQDGASILLVCKTLHNIAAPFFFDTLTFGHHASDMLKEMDDPFSLVLVPASLPMDKFQHVCLDYKYASSILKVPGLWPWPNMKSLVVVDYSLEEEKASLPDGRQRSDYGAVRARILFMRDMREVCRTRDVHLSAYISLGNVQGNECRLVDGVYTAPERSLPHRDPREPDTNSRVVVSLVEEGPPKFRFFGTVSLHTFKTFVYYVKSVLA